MAYEIQLNIGLDVSDNYPQLQRVYGKSINPALAVDTIYEMLDLAGDITPTSLSHRVEYSHTERTVVARLTFSTQFTAAIFLAALARQDKLIASIGQDCIAVYDLLESRGALVGEHADRWGTFNKECFIAW